MTKRNSSILLSIILTAVCHVSAAQISKPFFYRVAKNGAVSYILGTQHFGINFNELPPVVEKSLTSSNLLITEMVYTPQELNLWFTDYVTAVLNETKKYPRSGDPLTEEQKSKVIETLSLPPKLLDSALATSCGLYLMVGFPTSNQMDFQIQQIAYRHKISMQQLDTIELRNLADQTDDAKNGKCDLRNSIGSLTKAALMSYLSDQNDTYRSGDEKSFQDPSPGITIRNSEWIKTLVPAMDRGGVFVDVGVEHLFGDDGILELLQKSGATIERVP